MISEIKTKLLFEVQLRENVKVPSTSAVLRNRSVYIILINSFLHFHVFCYGNPSILLCPKAACCITRNDSSVHT